MNDSYRIENMEKDSVIRSLKSHNIENEKKRIENIINEQEKIVLEQKQELEKSRQEFGERFVNVFENIIREYKSNIKENKRTLKYMREHNFKDFEERMNILKNFGKEINESIPDGIPVVFHGTCNIGTVYDILQTGGLKTPIERGVSMRSFAQSIDVTNKYDIRTSLEFAEPECKGSFCMPYGAIFAFFPREEEQEKCAKECGSEVQQGVKSIDFKKNNDRFVGIITTEENKERIQAWLSEFEMDSNKVFTHSEFIEMCKDKFKELKNDRIISLQQIGQETTKCFVNNPEQAISAFETLEYGVKTQEKSKEY